MSASAGSAGLASRAVSEEEKLKFVNDVLGLVAVRFEQGALKVQLLDVVAKTTSGQSTNQAVLDLLCELGQKVVNDAKAS